MAGSLPSLDMGMAWDKQGKKKRACRAQALAQRQWIYMDNLINLSLGGALFAR